MSTPTYHPSLALYVVWHPGAPAVSPPPEAGQLAHALHAHFHRDARRLLSRGLGIPVFFRGVPTTPGGPPADIPLDDAEHTVVILLIDDTFIIDPAWEQYALRLHQRVAGHAPGKHLLLPVQMGANRLELGTRNAIRLTASAPLERERQLTLSITHELCRLLLGHQPARNGAGQTPLSSAPVKLFLSHAKLDGQQLAEKLHQYLSSSRSIGVETFFDSRDIPAGSDFAQEIEGNVERSALVVLQTDAYSSRPWCRREVLTAKRLGCPVVVVNAITSEEERSFPYLGNTPSLRWEPQGADRARDVLDMALREVLRATYMRFHLRSLQRMGWIPAQAELQPRLPEVITCLAPSTLGASQEDSTLVVYPDPPLGQEELELLAEANPRLRLSTPTALAMGGTFASGPRTLDKRKVALSTSESAELPGLGLEQEHLDVAWLEFVRHLLAAGSTVLYGGDLRSGGFTEALVDLVMEHRRSARELEGSIVSYIAWPWSMEVSAASEAQLVPKLRFRKLTEDTGMSPEEQQVRRVRLGSLARPTDGTVEDQHVLALNLTAMRGTMAQESHASILLGGRMRGFRGTMPGLVEEAWLTMKDQRPLYVVGGFGGCSRAIANALLGQPAPGLELAAREDSARALVEYRRELGMPAGNTQVPEDTHAAEQFFRARGLAGLNNGLSEEENRRLMVTPHVPEMIFLVLKGLSRLPEPGRPALPA
ncbi:TIR domain-containing protein [Archangium violaceum]|uniref:TIR domain-containing protein n=1 Tax=Archangium violaceum Cb vi76 TaxID=1406225 RepID=A0A084T0C0_9BACT|nr:TIR domain-containing protein [Archangium violaceum]KFA94155.1 hypothetical protein Q664_04310 [Archangium violaceum Cb vi76]